jgi:hypothetical protein
MGGDDRSGVSTKQSEERSNAMTVGKIVLVATVLMVSASPSVAQRPLIPTPFDTRGTPEDQAACRPDARKYCREHVGNDMAVLACFQQNRSKLSDACAAVLRKYGK